MIWGIRFERERVWKWKGFEKISRFDFGNKFERGRRNLGVRVISGGLRKHFEGKTVFFFVLVE